MTGSLPAGGPVDEPPSPERFDPTRILETLHRHGVRYVLIGGLAATLHVPILVADLDDIIASKEAANRPKDAAQLPLLYALRDDLRKQGHNDADPGGVTAS